MQQALTEDRIRAATVLGATRETVLVVVVGHRDLVGGTDSRSTG